MYCQETVKLETLNNAEHDLSKRYKLIPTQSVLDRFIAKGFYVSKVSLPKSIKAAHIVRLRHDKLKLEGKDFIEVVIMNSYNGTMALKINLGVYRLICSNGMVAGKNLFSHTIKHVGQNFYEQVDEAIVQIMRSAKKLEKVINKFKAKILSDTEIALFAEHCYTEKLKTEKKLFYIDLDQSIIPRRFGDQAKDLWTVLNVIQERIIRGGIRYATLETSEVNENWLAVWHNKSRAVNSIRRGNSLNEFVFDQALKLVA